MIVYDCEIINGVQPHAARRRPGIRYCKGWKDYIGMGISCICVWDFREFRYRVFLKDNLFDFAALVAARKVIVGFNNYRFDDPLCQAHGINIPDHKSYDLLADIISSIGDDRSRHKGLSLNNIARENLQRCKTGSGGDAPALWQQGKYGTVIDYCLNDVALTAAVFKRVIITGEIKDPRKGYEGNFISVLGPNMKGNRND